MKYKKSLKKVVFELLDKNPKFLSDQEVAREYNGIPDFRTVMNYEYKWRRLKRLQEQKSTV